MNRQLIFIFALLIILSTVDCKTKFEACKDYPLLINVALSPDPMVRGKNDTFTVSGKLQADILDTTVLIVMFSEPGTEEALSINNLLICSETTGIKCPVKNGTDFSTDAKISIPKNLPEKYNTHVVIFERAD